MIAELVAKIKVDISDLDKAKVAMRDFEGTLKGAFKREPGAARPEAALGGFIEQLSSGDFIGAIESVTRRLGVIGIVGTAVFGALAIGIKSAIAASQELDAKFEAMNKTLTQTPSTGLGMQGLNQMAQQGATQLEDIVKPKVVGIQEALGKAFRSVPQIAVGAFTGGVFSAAQQTLHIAELDRATKEAEIAAKVTQTSDALKEEAKLATDMAALTGARASGNEKLTAEMQAQLDLDKASAQTTSEMNAFWVSLGDAIVNVTDKQREQLNIATDLVTKQRAAAAKSDHKVALDTATRTTAIKQDEVATEEEIAKIKAQALNADAEKSMIAQANISHLQTQLDLSQRLDKSKRDQLQAELDMAKAEETAHAKRTWAAGLKPLYEATQLSFQDLLAADPHKGSIAMIEGHQAALRAQREQTIGEGLASRGFQSEAFIHLARAAEIKAGIPILKEAEKNEYAFKAAIDSATVFETMKKYLASIAESVSQTTNPFLNK